MVFYRCPPNYGYRGIAVTVGYYTCNLHVRLEGWYRVSKSVISMLVRFINLLCSINVYGNHGNTRQDKMVEEVQKVGLDTAEKGGIKAETR